MSELTFDYMRDIQADDGTEARQLVERYSLGGASVRRMIAGMSIQELRARPVEGRWSTMEVVGHLADCDQMMAERMKRTLGMRRPILVGMDPTDYPRALRHNDRSVEVFLQIIDQARSEMAEVLLSCSDADWRRDAVHTETGLVTLRQLVFHAIRHIEHHRPFIEEKRAALKGSSD